MEESVLSVKQFTKSYGSNLAVNNITFEVMKGEIFGLLGPNGSGKTSTLETLEGIRLPDSGSLRVLNLDPSRQTSELIQRIGIQLQSSALPATMTVEESMRFFCAYHHVQPRFELLERMNLGEKRTAEYGSLSIGQQRRLALALAISHNPEILFLDEPTAGLDVASRVELHAIMHELKAAGTTIILATHDMAEAEKMADRVAILLKGKLAAIGTPQQLTAQGNRETRISVNTELSCLSKNGVSFPGIRSHRIQDDYNVYFTTQTGPAVSSLIRYIEEMGDTLIDLRVERPTLEERFLEITNQ